MAFIVQVALALLRAIAANILRDFRRSQVKKYYAVAAGQILVFIYWITLMSDQVL